MGLFIIAVTVGITVTINIEVEGIRAYRLALAKGASQEELKRIKFESGALLTFLW